MRNMASRGQALKVNGRIADSSTYSDAIFYVFDMQLVRRSFSSLSERAHIARYTRGAAAHSRSHVRYGTPTKSAVTAKRGVKRTLDVRHGSGNAVFVAPNGDAIAFSASIGMLLGSREASSSTGLVLNNALHSFTARDPNRYLGHAGVSLNHPRPGKRPLSPLAPCVVLDGDRNLMAAVAASELFQVPQYSATVSNAPFLSIDVQRTPQGKTDNKASKPSKETTKQANTTENDGGGMVKCEGCDRWVDLEATPFEALEEAEASRYRCALCIKIEVLQEILENALMKAKEEWREREECLNTLFEEEKTLRTAEQAKREKLEKQVAELINTLETIQGETRKERRPPSPHMTQEGEGRIQETGQVRQEGMMAPPRGRRNSQVGNETQEVIDGDSEVIDQNGEKASRVENEEKTKAEEVTSTDREKTDNTGARTKIAFLLGDANAEKLKPVLEEEVKDARMKTWFKSRATLGQTLEQARDLKELDEKKRALVVIHAGMEDVMSGQEVTSTIETTRIQLKELLEKSQWHCYAICAVPMVQTRGQETLQRATELNDSLRRLCREMGPRVDFVPVTGMWNRPGWLQGTQYSKKAAEHVMTRMSARFRAFLETPRGPKTPRRKEGKRDQLEGLLRALMEQLKSG
ncbi:scoloptoxin SSD14-like [Ixodes scapularis]